MNADIHATRILAAISCWHKRTGDSLPDADLILEIENEVRETWREGFSAGRNRRSAERAEIESREARYNGAA